MYSVLDRWVHASKLRSTVDCIYQNLSTRRKENNSRGTGQCRTSRDLIQTWRIAIEQETRANNSSYSDKTSGTLIYKATVSTNFSPYFYVHLIHVYESTCTMTCKLPQTFGYHMSMLSVCSRYTENSISKNTGANICTQYCAIDLCLQPYKNT